MEANYTEIEATPSSTGGSNGGLLHRVYSVPQTGKAGYDLRQSGWEKMNILSGCYANTELLKLAKRIAEENKIALSQVHIYCKKN